jgi:hypothetical protein
MSELTQGDKWRQTMIKKYGSMEEVRRVMGSGPRKGNTVNPYFKRLKEENPEELTRISKLNSRKEGKNGHNTSEQES